MFRHKLYGTENETRHNSAGRTTILGRNLLTVMCCATGIFLSTPACSFLKIDGLNSPITGKAVARTTQTEGAGASNPITPSEPSASEPPMSHATAQTAVNSATWLEGYSTLLQAFQQRIDDEAAPEPEYCQTNDCEPITFNAAGTGEYALYDIDGNGTPELMIKLGDCEAASRTYLFSFSDNKVNYLGMLLSGHTVFGALTNPGILVERSHMDYESTLILILENGKFAGQEVQSRKFTPNSKRYKFEFLSYSDLDDATGLQWSKEQYKAQAQTNQTTVDAILTNK